LETDLNVNSLVYPGEVFVMANVGQNRFNLSDMQMIYNEIDINFKHKDIEGCPNNPWG